MIPPSTIAAPLTVRDIARDALAGSEPDPHVIARRCLSRLSPDQRDEVLVKGMTAVVMEELRSARRRPDTAIAVAPRVGVSKRRRSYRHDRRPTSHGWVAYTDCTVADLDELIAGYDGIIAGAERERDELRAMRDALAASGCSTVGELLTRLEVAA